MPIWGEDEKIYQSLPAFAADSLPDAWGNQLFDLWRRQNHIPASDINPLDKLSFIGRRGMGALEFVPEVNGRYKIEDVNIESLALLAERIFKERENIHILPTESITMQSLLTVGTSAGGRQPKAVIAINKNNGEIRSGQVAELSDYEYFILKFGNSEYCSAELEMVYYVLATNANISMMPSNLYSIDGKKHFITQRFDRKDGTKLHVQTLAAICPGAESYEELMDVCRKLHLPESECLEVFRRMVFNIFSNNTDDHNKNFAFVMDKKGVWHLAPAYDITYVINIGGYLPEENHCMFLRSKLCNFSKEDILSFAEDNGIRRPEAIINEVINSLHNFRNVALKYGVSNTWIGRIETTINRNIAALGFENTIARYDSFDINGKVFTDIYIEQAYKGNYHIFAKIDGINRKFIITTKNPLHTFIDNTGISRLSNNDIRDMLISIFNP